MADSPWSTDPVTGTVLVSGGLPDNIDSNALGGFLSMFGPVVQVLPERITAASSSGASTSPTIFSATSPTVKLKKDKPQFRVTFANGESARRLAKMRDLKYPRKDQVLSGECISAQLVFPKLPDPAQPAAKSNPPAASKGPDVMPFFAFGEDQGD